MNHVYRWATTRYGPLADRLQGRLNEQCRVITRGRQPFETVWEFDNATEQVRPRTVGLVRSWRATR